MVRKIVAIEYHSQKATFLIAGTISHIKIFLEVLEGLKSGRESIPDAFSSKVSKSGVYFVIDAACYIAESRGFKEFEIIGVLGGHLLARQFDVNKSYLELPYFGRVVLAGSGAEYLNSILSEFGSYLAKSYPCHDAKKKMYTALMRIPRYLSVSDKSPNSQTLQNGVGGYYEQYKVGPNGFMPVGSVFSVVASIGKAASGFFVDLRQMEFQCYVKNILVVMVLDCSGIRLQEDQTVDIDENRMKRYSIPPIFQEPECAEISLSHVLHKMAATKRFNESIRANIAGGEKEIGGFKQGTNNTLLKVSIKKNSIRVSIRREALKELRKIIEKASKP